MRRAAVYIVLALLVQVSQAQRFTLQGRITGQDTGWISLSYTGRQGNWISDKQHVDKGIFVFTGRISGPTPAYLIGKRETKSTEDPHILRVYLDTGLMEITLPSIDFHQRVLRGARTQEELDAFNRSLSPISRRIKEATAAHRSVQTIDSLKTAYLTLGYAYAADHPGSYIAPDLIYIPILKKWLPQEAAKRLFYHLDPAVQNSDMGKRVAMALSEGKK
jgi:hypothetical protein